MSRHVWIIAALISSFVAASAVAQEAPSVSKTYQALAYTPPPVPGTWAILDRDGGSRKVDPYLSSLGRGEVGTGMIVSPTFTLSVDKITFTICGHDGHGGGRHRNFIALLDVESGKTLHQTFAPGSDPMQPRSWDVKELTGRQVRIEVHDDLTSSGFAWLGIGRIEGGPSMTIDFRQGMPADWKIVQSPTTKQKQRFAVLEGPISFRRHTSTYTMIPATGAVEIPCGFSARRLFFLGCTVAGGKPLEVYGHVEIIYRDGPPERYPLMYGFTLDEADIAPSRSEAIHLHASADPFQYYFVLRPRPGVIEKIKLSSNPEHERVVRITAVTCETNADSDHLAPLPDRKPTAREQAWIEAHTITPTAPKLESIRDRIRRGPTG